MALKANQEIIYWVGGDGFEDFLNVYPENWGNFIHNLTIAHILFQIGVFKPPTSPRIFPRKKCVVVVLVTTWRVRVNFSKKIVQIIGVIQCRLVRITFKMVFGDLGTVGSESTKCLKFWNYRKIWPGLWHFWRPRDVKIYSTRIGFFTNFWCKIARHDMLF